MHDAKLASLSKIEVGQTILVTANVQPRGFGRPKDPTAIPLRVTAKTFTPDQWSGKVWTLTLNDDSTTEPRYGTTHVYVTEAQAPAPQEQPEVEVETESGAKRVRVEPDGTVRVVGWTGGQVVERTPHGKLVRIDKHGVVMVIETGGVLRQPVLTPDTDAELDERNAGEPDPQVVNSDRCGQCKGYGVVRKRGQSKGQAYRTANGADQATANGNSVVCPVCQGETLVARAA
jgi:hypothetical protein